MMRYNCPSFSRNDSPSFRTRLCRSTPHSAFPKYIYWQGLRLLEILSQKQFVKRLSSWKRLCLQRIPVTYDQIICFAGVGFLSDGDEQPFRGSIVIEITGKMLPGDIELVKLHNEKVTSPLVTVGYNWDVNHVKTCLVKVTCMVGRKSLRAPDQDKRSDNPNGSKALSEQQITTTGEVEANPLKPNSLSDSFTIR